MMGDATGVGVGLVDTNAASTPPQRSPSRSPLAGAAMSPFSVTDSPEQRVSSRWPS